MSKNINQVFTANPIATNASTDLMYFGQSPYAAGNDAAMTFANFSAQFGAPFTPAALTRVNDTNVTVTLGGTPNTALLQATSLTLGWTGQLVETRGGTNQSTYTLGDTLYSSAANTLSKLAGNTTAVKQYLSQTGTGVVSAAPSWATISGSDITGAALTVGNDTNVTLTTGGTPATSLLRAASITAGWTGQLGLTRGGTNASLTASNGGIVWSNATQLQILAGTATANQVLLSGSTATPAWSTATYPATTTINQILFSSAANTITGITTANSAVLVTTSAGVPGYSGTMTNGQVIIGSTGATPTAATLTAGTGINITNGAGSITVASTGVGSLVWNDVSGTSQSAAVNNGYIISNAAQTTVTLPATSAEGSVFAVQGKGAAGWILQANTGQTIHLGNSATSSAGSLTSTNQWDSVTIVCVTANTTFAVTSVIGNLTVA